MREAKFVMVLATLFTIFGSAVYGVGKARAASVDHSAIEVSVKTEATGTGVINSINVGQNSINITHEPMPELGWPLMTMDLPVTRKVDLGKISAGDSVSFTVKLGRDKKYRVIELSSTDDKKRLQPEDAE